MADADSGTRPDVLGALLRGAAGDLIAPGVVRVELDLGAVGEALLVRYDARDAGHEPNSMHERGAPLAGLGGASLAAALRAEVAEPARRRWFAAELPAPLVDEYAYLVDYGERGDHDLALHVDESDLTLNLCLGDWFEGGELRFAGRRCGRHRQTEAREDELLTVPHAPGVGYLHLGAHRHFVPPLEQGRRRNLIVWCRSAGPPLSASMECAPFCGARP